MSAAHFQNAARGDESAERLDPNRDAVVHIAFVSLAERRQANRRLDLAKKPRAVQFAQIILAQDEFEEQTAACIADLIILKLRLRMMSGSKIG